MLPLLVSYISWSIVALSALYISTFVYELSIPKAFVKRWMACYTLLYCTIELCVVLQPCSVPLSSLGARLELSPLVHESSSVLMSSRTEEATFWPKRLLLAPYRDAILWDARD